MDIAVIGSNMVDLISYITRMPKEGETIEAPDFSMGCGGKGSNQAVAAARLGSKVLMMTRVGDDLFARNTIENYERNGIDTTHVQSVHGTSGVAPIFVDQQSHNSIIIVKGANNALRPEDVRAAADDIRQCKLIVLQLEIPLETVYAAIDLGTELGIPVLLNPAPANPHLDYGEVVKCDFFTPNETELATLTGMVTDTLDNIRAAALALVHRGCKNVIVTMGSRGVIWLDDQHELVLPQCNVDAIDTTGAGDAFIGCFSHYYVQGSSIADSLKFANQYAANSVTKRGTQKSYATAEEFERWVKETL